jgi:hypothetical protein
VAFLRRHARVFYLLLATLVLLVFQNCTQYSFRSLSEEVSLQSLGGGASGNGGGYDGKPDSTYYRFVPDFTCEGRSAPKDRLEIRGKKIYLFENHLQKCATESRELPPEEVIRSPLQSDWVSVSDYIFARQEYVLQAPPTSVDEVICRDDFLHPKVEIIARYNQEQKVSTTRVYTLDSKLGIDVIEDLSTKRVYTGQAIEYTSFAENLKFNVSLDQVIGGSGRKFSADILTAQGIWAERLSAKKLVCITSLYSAPPEILPLSLASSIRNDDSIALSSIAEHNGKLVGAAVVTPYAGDSPGWPLAGYVLPKSSLIGIYQSLDSGTSWKAIAKVQSTPGINSVNSRLLSAGSSLYLYGANGRNEIFIAESSNDGIDWKTSMKYAIPVATSIYVTGAALTNDNNIVVSGYTYSSTGSTSFVRKCNRTTWSCLNSDEFTSATTGSNRATQVIRDNLGNLYTTSRQRPDTYIDGVYVKKSTDNGTTWSILDQDETGSRNVNALAVSADGQMILYGGAIGASTPYVRQSTDGGVTWVSTTSVCAGWSVTNIVLAANKDALLTCYDFAGINPGGYGTFIGRKSASANSWSEIFRQAGSSNGSLFVRNNGEIVYFDPTLASVRVTNDFGSTWSGRSYPKPAAPSLGDAQFYSIVENSLGHLYASGYVTIAPSAKSAVVYKSIDGGMSWNLDYGNVFGNSNFTAIARSQSSANPNNLIAGGVANNLSWVVHKYDSATSSWAAVDTYSPANVAVAFLRDIVSGPSGRFWSLGGVVEWASGQRWVLRTSGDDGVTWSTIDNFQYFSGQNSEALGGAASGSDIYVAGYGRDTTGLSHWLVRKYSNGQIESLDDDTFGPASGGASAHAVLIASDGTLYAAGEYSVTLGPKRWVVKKKPLNGSWEIVDDFTLAGGADAVAKNLIEEPTTHRIFVSGSARDENGLQRSIVRVLNSSGGVTVDNYLDYSSTDVHKMIPCLKSKICMAGSSANADGMYRGFVKILSP